MSLPDTLPEGVKELGQVITRYHELRQLLTDFLVDVHTDAVQERVDRGELELEAEPVIEAIRDQISFGDDVERFIEANPELNEPERRALRDLVHPSGGVFRVTDRSGRLIRAHNLVDDLDHRVVLGHGDARQLRLYGPGTFFLSAVRPLLDGWILIGEQKFLPACQEPIACGLAAQLALEHPHLFFRNPAHLERAREQQQAEHERFVQRFGAPWAVGTAEQVEAWLAELAGKQGRIPEDLRDAEQLALVSHPRAGQFFVTDLHRVLEALQDPGLAASDPHRAALLGLLEDDETPAALFELLEQHGALSPALASALHRPGLDWARDGLACLREHRSPQWNPDAPVLPSTVPLPPDLQRGLDLVRHASAGGQTPGTGGQTPGAGGPGAGGQTPGAGGQTPGAGGQTPGAGGQTLGAGGPPAGGQTPRNRRKRQRKRKPGR